LVQQWLNHYTNEVEEKLDDDTLVEAFKGTLIPTKATWTSIVRILWENEEFQDPEVQICGADPCFFNASFLSRDGIIAFGPIRPIRTVLSDYPTTAFSVKSKTGIA
jgi:hypothetical protein